MWYTILYNMQLEPIRAIFKEFQPDIVVADFFSLAMIQVADELNIQCVINQPGVIRKFMIHWDLGNSF